MFSLAFPSLLLKYPKFMLTGLLQHWCFDLWCFLWNFNAAHPQYSYSQDVCVQNNWAINVKYPMVILREILWGYNIWFVSGIFEFSLYFGLVQLLFGWFYCNTCVDWVTFSSAFELQSLCVAIDAVKHNLNAP